MKVSEFSVSSSHYIMNFISRVTLRIYFTRIFTGGVSEKLSNTQWIFTPTLQNKSVVHLNKLCHIDTKIQLCSCSNFSKANYRIITVVCRTTTNRKHCFWIETFLGFYTIIYDYFHQISRQWAIEVILFIYCSFPTFHCLLFHF